MSDDLTTIAERHGFSRAAAEEAARALKTGGGRQAQFNHPELGGMGQWMPGMLMIAVTNNAELKRRVDALFADLAGAGTPTDGAKDAAQRWWPEELGDSPTTSGAQNHARYAWFAGAKRLVVEESGSVAVYDTGGRRLTGVAQQQSDTTRTLTFTTPDGPLNLSTLRRVSEGRVSG
jgi:hypothetical protein